MRVKRAALISIALLLVCSFVFAGMTIWFKNGNSIQVYKIVFQGNIAELYLMDGSVHKYPVEQIDLKSSGITKPQGTYGGTGTRPSQLPITTPPTAVDQESRQAQLKEEWEQTEKTAVAQKSIGPIRKGDVVRIVGETQASPSTGYYGIPQSHDDAYVVLYRNPDGSYGKKLFDAVTFAQNFKLEEKPKPVVTLPLEPRIPEAVPAVDTAPASPPVESAKPEPPPQETKPETSPVVVPRTSGTEEEQPPVFKIMIGAVLLTGVAVVVVLLTRKRRKAFIDSSKFSQYEEELRDFEIEIWLKHGKTMDQLLEICGKKFYGDQPGPMSAMAKMLKGLDRNAVVAFIGKQGEMDPETSARTYDEMKRRLDWCRTAIETVSKRTGRMPAEPLAPTGVIPAPVQPFVAPTGVIPVPGSTPQSREIPQNGIIPGPKPETPTSAVVQPAVAAVPRQSPAPPDPLSFPSMAPAHSAPDLPPYLGNVFRSLALLSTTPDKFEGPGND